MRIKYLVLINVIIGLLTACNGMNTDDVSNKNNGFAVSSVQPTENSKIPVNSNFTISFNKNLDDSAPTNINLINETTGKSEVISCSKTTDTTIQCTPKNTLASGTGYDLVLPSSIHNKAQNPLTPKIIKFTTLSQPVVINASPESGTIGLNITEFNYIFNESMSVNTLNTVMTANNVVFTDTTTNTIIPITCNSKNNITIQCNIVGGIHLTHDHTYTLMLTNLIQSAVGVNLTPSTYSYTAGDYTQPVVVKATPDNNSNVPLNTTSFTYVFSEAMNPDTLNTNTTANNVTLTDTTINTNLPIICTAINSKEMQCNVVGTPKLAYDHSYTLMLTNLIQSSLGVNLTLTAYSYIANNYNYTWSLFYNIPFANGVGGDLDYADGVLHLISEGNNTENGVFFATFMDNQVFTSFNPNYVNGYTYDKGIIYTDSTNSPYTIYTSNTVNSTFVSAGHNLGTYNSSATQLNHDIYFLNQNKLHINNGGIWTIIDTPLPSNQNTTIMNDGNSIYVKASNGLFNYSNGVFTNISFNLDTNNFWILSNNTNLYAVSDTELYKFTGTGWVKLPIQLSGQIMSRYFTKSYFYYSTSNGRLYKYNLSNYTTQDITPTGLYANYVNSLAQSEDGTLYITSGKQLYKGTIQ